MITAPVMSELNIFLYWNCPFRYVLYCCQQFSEVNLKIALASIFSKHKGIIKTKLKYHYNQVLKSKHFFEKRQFHQKLV